MSGIEDTEAAGRVQGEDTDPRDRTGVEGVETPRAGTEDTEAREQAQAEDTDAAGRVADVLGEFALWSYSRVWLAARLEPLPYVEMQTLHTVGARPGSTVSEVARLLGKQQSNVSTAVTSLVGRGLLERRRDGHDARCVRLYRTARAEAEGRTAGEAIAGLVRPTLASLSPAEVHELDRLLHRVVQDLEP